MKAFNRVSLDFQLQLCLASECTEFEIYCRYSQWGISLLQDDLKHQVQHCIQNVEIYTAIYISWKTLLRERMVSLWTFD